MPLLDRPTFDSANRFGTASAGQAVLYAATNVFFARPEQWHIQEEIYDIYLSHIPISASEKPGFFKKPGF